MVDTFTSIRAAIRILMGCLRLVATGVATSRLIAPPSSRLTPTSMALVGQAEMCAPPARRRPTSLRTAQPNRSPKVPDGSATLTPDLSPPSIDEIDDFYGQASCPDGSPSTPSSNPCDFRANRCDDPDGTPICEVEPGVYYGGWNITQNGTQVRLSPGIYVIAGGGIRLNSGTIETVSGDPTVDARVMIFSTDHPTRCPAELGMCQGPIRFAAS